MCIRMYFANRIAGDGEINPAREKGLCWFGSRRVFFCGSATLRKGFRLVVAYTTEKAVGVGAKAIAAPLGIVSCGRNGGKGGRHDKESCRCESPGGQEMRRAGRTAPSISGIRGCLPLFLTPGIPPPLRPRVDSDPKFPYGLGVCIWMPPVNGTGNSPVSGTADPRSSQTGQVIRGLH